jgi:putative SOS response-associated peptidase YedK
VFERMTLTTFALQATPGSWTPVILHHRHAPPHDKRGQQPAPPEQRHPHEDTEVARPDTTPASAPDADGSSLPNKATKADNTEETFCIQTMRWGLVPSFTKQDAKPDPWRMFNARSETADQLASFRRLVPSRRCLVLVNGFYEWKKEGIDGKKQPYYIHLADAEEPMVMAGLWDTWQGPEGPLHTYTILTCDASKRLEWLHDRMPVILRDRASQEEWLTTKRPLESLQ